VFVCVCLYAFVDMRLLPVCLCDKLEVYVVKKCVYVQYDSKLPVIMRIGTCFGTHECISTYIYIRMYVCMHACMHACMQYLCMHVCMYIRMYVHTCYVLIKPIRMYVYTYIRMYVCIYIRMYVCMYIRMYVCIHTCIASCFCVLKIFKPPIPYITSSHTIYYVLTSSKPPIPYITSSPLCLLRVFAS
jgi:hypothetical protein